MKASDQKFEVFFDGDCPLCRREIDMVRRKDRNDALILTDIASPEFVADEIPLDDLMKEIHGRLPDGEFVKGVEVFRQIYSRLGFQGLTKVSRFPVLRHGLDLFYRMFAALRYKHAMHRMKRSTCTQDTCQVAATTTQAFESKPPTSSDHSNQNDTATINFNSKAEV